MFRLRFSWILFSAESAESPVYTPSSNTIPQFWYNTMPPYNYPLTAQAQQHAVDNNLLKKTFDARDAIKSQLPHEQTVHGFNGIGGHGLVKFDYALSECKLSRRLLITVFLVRFFICLHFSSSLYQLWCDVRPSLEKDYRWELSLQCLRTLQTFKRNWSSGSEEKEECKFYDVLHKAKHPVIQLVKWCFVYQRI